MCAERAQKQNLYDGFKNNARFHDLMDVGSCTSQTDQKRMDVCPRGCFVCVDR
jgi:hypothetical protein